MGINAHKFIQEGLNSSEIKPIYFFVRASTREFNAV